MIELRRILKPTERASHLLKEWRWKTLPTSRAALHHSFRNIPGLLVSCIKVPMDRAA
jgi:hypothetical protein